LCLATVDVKKFIFDLACNSYDTQIAVVIKDAIFGTVDESIVRIYDVGRFRNEDEAVSFFLWLF